MRREQPSILTHLNRKGGGSYRVKFCKVFYPFTFREDLVDMAKGLDTELLEFLPEDSNVQRFNMNGNPLIGLPDDSPSVLVMKDILEKLRVI